MVCKFVLFIRIIKNMGAWNMFITLVTYEDMNMGTWHMSNNIYMHFTPTDNL